MLDRIRARREDVYRLAREHNAKRLYVFGSCARQQEREDSDIDFLVKFTPEASLIDTVVLENKLAAMFGRGVDVVSTAVLRREPRFAYHVCQDVVPV